MLLWSFGSQNVIMSITNTFMNLCTATPDYLIKPWSIHLMVLNEVDGVGLVYGSLDWNKRKLGPVVQSFRLKGNDGGYLIFHRKGAPNVHIFCQIWIAPRSSGLLSCLRSRYILYNGKDRTWFWRYDKVPSEIQRIHEPSKRFAITGQLRREYSNHWKRAIDEYKPAVTSRTHGRHNINPQHPTPSCEEYTFNLASMKHMAKTRVPKITLNPAGRPPVTIMQFQTLLLPPDLSLNKEQATYDANNQQYNSMATSSHPRPLDLMNAGRSNLTDSLPILAPIMSPQYMITLRSTYRSTSITLAQSAFFGASLAYANLFTYVTPQPVFLAWAASTFVVGAVGAGTMGFFGQFDSIWNDNRPTRSSTYMNAQEPQEFTGEWLVGAFGCISCALVFVGLVMLNLSMIVSAFKLDTHDAFSTTFNKVGIVTAGLFSISGSMSLMAGALYVRYRGNSPVMRASRFASQFELWSITCRTDE
ncbi:uncharacterized protein MELLADRAFT_111558 [Melampsora larici-populina 98AG31]|uniref:Uncharacterized protein n=1 Tax=Melampsora larici-populina (strain 98AG31 / pathotype 3-4-7) TaxID=747676 RepID=F4S3L0_MELLP|nr:uncharacterized protein MELLADRAFT_111558 [Melampsora larici-populina 98AG31]EGG00773.1 hypothetical protein MELLADRAFT_111558 [Melampsora larici-populina 98AG31]